MCGVFGFAGAPGAAREVDLRRALESLRHRGPDDQGTYFGVASCGEETACALAFTRLAILDLSPAGHQPMSTADGRFTIVLNGEIYNFAEVRSHLIEKGHRFESTGDTEVALKSYAEWGKDFARRLSGMFALAIWDAAEGTLLLARDRVGIKPLYYTETPSGIAFSSEVRTLLNTGLAERRISPEGLLSYLSFGSVAEPETIVEGVFALPPGHVAEYRDGKFSLQAYWSLPSGPVRERSFDEAVEELKPVLGEAVRSHLTSDVPLGIFLSGGIDSSVLTALAARQQDTPVHSFTVTFDEEEFSEGRYAREVAARFGCDHHHLHLEGWKAAGEIDAALKAYDQPSADGLNTYFVAKAARESGLTVALSGLGGDEVFGGYSNFRKFGKYLAAGKAGRIVPDSITGSRWATKAGTPNRARKLAALLSAKGDAARTYDVLRGMFGPSQVARLLGGNRGRTEVPPRLSSTGSVVGGSEPRDVVNLLSNLELSGYLKNTLLRDTDCMSMAHALEVRVPLLDHRVIELMSTFPGALKIGGPVNKPLLVAAAPEIPSSSVSRRKMGFVLPLDRWFRGPMANHFSGVLLGRNGSGPPLLDPGATSEIWRAFLRGEKFISHSRICCLASLIAWSGENRMRLDPGESALAVPPRPLHCRRSAR